MNDHGHSHRFAPLATEPEARACDRASGPESGIFAAPVPCLAPSWAGSDSGDPWVHLLGTFLALELG